MSAERIKKCYSILKYVQKQEDTESRFYGIYIVLVITYGIPRLGTGLISTLLI